MIRRDGELVRHSLALRLNHWITAGCFMLLLLSGLSFFDPMLFWLSALFGGGQSARALHPWIGVVLLVSYAGMVVQSWRGNLWTRDDVAWIRHMPQVLANREEAAPEVGRYNAGQKVLFWLLALCMLGLFVTGFCFWRPLADGLPILLVRFATLFHAVCATGLDRKSVV